MEFVCDTNGAGVPADGIVGTNCSQKNAKAPRMVAHGSVRICKGMGHISSFGGCPVAKIPLIRPGFLCSMELHRLRACCSVSE